VLGAGSVGLLTTLTLRAAGVRDVMVADLMANRLELAEGLGGRPLDADGLDRLNKEVATAPSAAPRCVFETAGNAVTMDRAIGLCRRGGTVILVGYTKSGRADLNVNLLIDKELTVRTVFRYRGCYPPAIAAVASGAIPVGQVVSSVFPFDQAQAAMDHAIRAKADVTKCVIAVDPERGIRA
jgi:L-iditol 2-dehydrogenase